MVRFLFLILLALAPIHGAFRLNMNPANPVVGEQVSIVADFSGLKGSITIASRPTLPGIEMNWDQNPSRSQSTSIVNGRMSQSITYTWTGRAKAQGKYTSTPLVVKAGQNKHSSSALTYSIRPPQTSKFYLFQAKLNRGETVVGDAVVLHLDFALADQQIRSYERYMKKYEFAGQHYDSIAIPPELEQDFHVRTLQSRSARGSQQLFGVEAPTRQINGFPYRIHRVTLELEPKQEGRLRIPPFSTTFYDLALERSFFGVQARRKNPPYGAKTAPLYLKVSAPPPEGRPTTYNGQVCEKLELKLTSEDIQPGQTVQKHAPISVVITLSSDRAGLSLRDPMWHLQQAWYRDFYVNTQAMERKDGAFSATYSGIILRPKNTQLRAIPPLEVSYFNPQENAYAQASSDPFPIVVETVSDEAVLEDQASEILELQRKATVARPSLHGLETSPKRLRESPPQHSWSWVFWGLCAFIWMGAAVPLASPGVSRWAEGRKSSRQNQLKRLRQNIDAAPTPEAVLQALHLWSSEHHHDFSKQGDPKLTEALGALENASYGGGQLSLEEAKSKALIIAQSLEEGS